LKKIITVGALVFTVLLTGCASVGNETLRKESESSMSGKMTEGRTTKAEVRSLFGSPLKTTFTDGGLEIWNYEFTNVSLDAISYVPIVNMFGATSSGKKKELVVLFDQVGVIKRYSMSESDVKNKTGLFNQ